MSKSREDTSRDETPVRRREPERKPAINGRKVAWGFATIGILPAASFLGWMITGEDLFDDSGLY